MMWWSRKERRAATAHFNRHADGLRGPSSLVLDYAATLLGTTEGCLCSVRFMIQSNRMNVEAAGTANKKKGRL
jgi:hypothetical protein